MQGNAALPRGAGSGTVPQMRNEHCSCGQSDAADGQVAETQCMGFSGKRPRFSCQCEGARALVVDVGTFRCSSLMQGTCYRDGASADAGSCL